MKIIAAHWLKKEIIATSIPASVPHVNDSLEKNCYIWVISSNGVWFMTELWKRYGFSCKFL